jgi:DNA-binding NtrC family response regulator
MVGRVLFLDDDDDLVDAMTDALSDDGRWECVGVHSVAELHALGAGAIGCQLAILDINLGVGVASGIDAYHWLRERQFGGRVLFLTGHARSHPLVGQAASLEGVRVLQKPITLERLLMIIGGEKP